VIGFGKPIGMKPLEVPAMSDLWKPVQLVPYVRTISAAKVTSVLCIVQIASETVFRRLPPFCNYSVLRFSNAMNDFAGQRSAVFRAPS
jgi:hypothetical protein